MHVQLFNGILTMILQHLQKDQLICVHLLSISYSTDCNTNEVSITRSYDDHEQSSEVSESELGYSKPVQRER